MSTARLPETLWFRENRMTITADAQSTGGSLSLIDCRSPGGSGPPLHRHGNDETFYVLEGEVAFIVDGAIHRTRAGECMFVPGNAAHTFRVISPEARIIVVCTPGGHEELFRLAGGPALDDGLPPLDDGPPDMARLLQAASVSGAEILGPPPAELLAVA